MLQETAIETMESSLTYLMKNYASYNHWANKTMVDWLSTKPAELMTQDVTSSFPTIKQTLIHIYQTQSYWLSVIQKDKDFKPHSPNGSTEEIFQILVSQSEKIVHYIEQMTSEEVQENNLVVNPWFECNYPNFEYIMQCMNHSTYHRGQVVTMGRILGITDAPMTDYNFYNVRGK